MVGGMPPVFSENRDWFAHPLFMWERAQPLKLFSNVS
jgi:hypothetical protein